MARARNIKPGFFTNEELGSLNPLARILFAGLWTEADRKGVLEDRPMRLKPRLLPFDNCDVNQLLEDLQRAKFILRYKADGKSLIYIVNFTAHQNPHHTEKDSSLQAPTVQQLRSITVNSPLSNGETTDKIRVITEHSQDASCEFPSDSLLLIPDSGFPKTDSVAPKPSVVISGDDAFEVLYERHPKKGDRGLAQNYLAQSVGNGADLSEIDRVHKLYCEQEWTQPQFAPKLAQWLLDQGWKYLPKARASPISHRQSERDAVWEQVMRD